MLPRSDFLVRKSQEKPMLLLDPLSHESVKRFLETELACIKEEDATITPRTLKLLSYNDVLLSLRIKKQPTETKCKKCKIPEPNQHRFMPPFQQDPFPAFLPKIPPRSKFVHDLEDQKIKKLNAAKIVVRLPRLPQLPDKM